MSKENVSEVTLDTDVEAETGIITMSTAEFAEYMYSCGYTEGRLKERVRGLKKENTKLRKRQSTGSDVEGLEFELCTDAKVTGKKEAEKPVPDWLRRERDRWRRFELVADDWKQIRLLNKIFTKHNLTGHEIAVILSSIRIRTGFSLEDF